jgi:HD superfamily phosphodiesterase
MTIKVSSMGRRRVFAAVLLSAAAATAGAVRPSVATDDAAPRSAATTHTTATTAATKPATKPAAAGGDWRNAVQTFAREHFKHPAWGYSHSSRDYALARELAAKDGVRLDDDVLYAAAYLHDLAAFAPWADEKKDHADVAADTVHTILDGTGFPMAKVDAVRSAIRTHMYFRDPVGPEAVYLHDADALDWLGAIGVARIMALVDANGGAPDGPAMAKDLEDNLAKVPNRVVSPAGRAMVPGRKTELETFLKQLRAESRDYQDL